MLQKALLPGLLLRIPRAMMLQASLMLITSTPSLQAPLRLSSVALRAIPLCICPTMLCHTLLCTGFLIIGEALYRCYTWQTRLAKQSINSALHAQDFSPSLTVPCKRKRAVLTTAWTSTDRTTDNTRTRSSNDSH